MIEWIIIGLIALIWEGIGVYTRHKQSQPDPWGSTTLTWLLLRIAKVHRYVRWTLLVLWLVLGWHFFIQHNVLGA